MAPEIFQDDGVHSYYSDMWSFGCILYELATGKPPFYTSSLKDLVNMIQDNPTPTIPEFSDEFNDLLCKLLEKEPTCRPSWEELCNHPFWKGDPLKTLPMPEQPQFDEYLRGKGIDPEHFYAQRSNPLAKKLIRESAKLEKSKQTVDMIRLSHNVKNNLRENDKYINNEDPNSDIKLKNRDQELNFGKIQLIDDNGDKSPNKIDTEHDLIEEEKVYKIDLDEDIKKPSMTDTSMSKQPNRGKVELENDFDKEENYGPAEIDHSANLFPDDNKNDIDFVEVTDQNSKLPQCPEKIGNKTVEQLLIHNIDTSVKPIIGNRDIERQNELRYSQQHLTFNPWKIEDIVEAINSTKIGKFSLYSL